MSIDIPKCKTLEQTRYGIFSWKNYDWILPCFWFTTIMNVVNAPLMGHMKQGLSHAQVMVHQKAYVKKKALTMYMWHIHHNVIVKCTFVTLWFG